MRLLLLVVLLLTTGTSWTMAVDRSKFRTCQQTSFCRRHRDLHSARLYKYKLTHVHFHTPAEEKDVGQQQQQQQDKGMWKSFQRKLLGKDGDKGVDPYVRGPPPTLTGTLVNTAKETSTASHEQLQWTVSALQDGMLRMRITEIYGTPNSAYEQARVTYDELVLETPEQWRAAEEALWIRPSQEDSILKKLVPSKDDINNYMALQYGDNADNLQVLLIQLEPFGVSLYRESNLEAGPIMEFGHDEMMHFEIRRFPDSQLEEEKGDKDKEEEKTEEKKEDKPEKEIVGYWEDGLAIYADGTREERKDQAAEDHRQLTEAELDREGLWEESFGSHKDSKPHGPMSVGMDISFPQSKHLYGIPEHASSTVLQTTRGDKPHYKDPYRLYNLDVFEYEVDEAMALYGSVPLVVSQSKTTGTAGVFWFNPTETFVDVMQEDNKSTTHWMSESGVIDIFMLPGPDPATMYQQYTKLTGTIRMPPLFSLGYHQCRWNYKDEKDVYFVHGKFEELDYPYDVLWLDIEHTDGKKYFTWDSNLFPTPKEMQETLASQGRRMVTIIDPHIKRDNSYYIHKEATAKGLYIKDKDGKNDYDGWCWPGSSSYLDFMDENVRSWWADQFKYQRYKGSTPTLFTWNDMNEPSVFNGPEITMQKDLKNLKGEEHREWHNVYGMLFQRASEEGLLRRNADEDVRPFVLSRAFFAGSQRYGAIWTGDNTADWAHLEIAAPMLLSLNVAGLSFVGADVGGFFGNPDAELFTRWYQAAAYQPFFRGHAHHDSKRREPWTYDEETLVRLRHAAMARYALLPYWYTVFHEAETTGMPVMRTMWMQYPESEHFYGIDDQYMVGSDLMVKPVTSEGATEATVLFPTDDLWYNAESLLLASSSINPKAVESKVVPADIDTIPVYQRGGSIIPRKLRLRRSSMTMKDDPYTLYIALDDSKKARGELYMDDEESFGYKKRMEFANATFTADLSGKTGTIGGAVTLGSGWADLVNDLEKERMIERVVIMGVKAVPKKIAVADDDLEFNFNADSNIVVIRKPNVSALKEWTMTLSY